MAISPPSILSKFRLKPSTSLKASKYAIFTILALMSVQATTSGLLWYAKHVRASGAISTASSITNTPNNLIHSPWVTATDSSNNVYTMDYSSPYHVQVFSSSGQYIQDITLSTVPPFLNSIYPNTIIDMVINSSGDIILLSGPHDSPSTPHIWRYSPSGTLIASWGITGDGDEQLQSPAALTVDATGNIYVAGGQSSSNFIKKFDTNGNFLFKWGGEGAANGQFLGTAGITIDSDGNVLVLDQEKLNIQKFNPSNGAYISKWTVPNYYGYRQQALKASSNHIVYLASTSNSTMYQYDSSTGGLIRQWQYMRPPDSNTQTNMAADNLGNVYVQNWGYGYSIMKFNSSGVKVGELGRRAAGNLDGPTAMAEDASGNLYVADTGNDRIQVFDSNGNYVRQWGDSGSADGQFTRPGAVAISPSTGNVYVLDSYSRVQMFSSTGVFIKHWDEAGDGLTSPSYYFSKIAVDGSGNVYVSDHGGRVYKLAPGGGVTTQFTTAYVNSMTCDGAGNLYVNSAGNIYKYDSNGSQLALNTSLPSGLGAIGLDNNGHSYHLVGNITKYSAATHLVVGSAAGIYSSLILEPNGRIVVADAANNRILKLSDSLALEIITPTGALHVGDTTVNYSDYSQTIDTADAQSPVSFSVTSGSLPPGITLAPTGDQNGKGILSGVPTAIGLYSFTVTAQDTSTSQSRAFSIRVRPPRSVTTRPSSNPTQIGVTLHGITNYPNSMTSRGFEYGVSQSYGSLVEDTTSPTSMAHTRTFASGISQNPPNDGYEGIVADGADNTYLVDTENHNIRKFNSAGVFQSTFGTNSGLVTPERIAIDSADNIYVTDSGASAVFKFNSAGVYQSQFGSAGTANGQLAHPLGIAIDSTGNIFVADSNNFRVQKFNSAGVYQSQFGSQGTGDGEFDFPESIAIDSANNLFVLDNGTSRVQKFNSAGVYQSQFGSLQPAFGDGGLFVPTGITIDSANNIYIADSGNNRIQKFNSAGVYQSQFGSYGTGNEQFLRPASVAMSPSDEVYVYDADSFLIKKLSTSIDSQLSGLTCGTTYHYRAFATDGNSTTYGSDATFDTAACPAAINITTTSLPAAYPSVPYSQYIDVENVFGQVNYYIIGGNLPSGISLSSTGFLEGTTTVTGQFDFTVEVIDDRGSGDGDGTDTQNLILIVTDGSAPPLQILTTTLPDARVGIAYDQYIYTQDGLGVTTFSLVGGALPQGLSLESIGDTGRITGTPTDRGTSYFQVQAQDSRGNVYANYQITVEAGVAITSTVLQGGIKGISYRYQVEADTTGAATFTVAAGSLPPGLSLGLDGLLSGVPTTVGDYPVTLRVEDSLDSATRDFIIKIYPPPVQPPNTPFVTITSPITGTTLGQNSTAITGTGPKNQTIVVLIDDVSVGTALVDGNGTWTYAAGGIAPGNHTVKARWAPASDIGFMPFLDFLALPGGQSGVQVIDHASGQVIKTINLPNGVIAQTITLNHSRTKLYIAGMDLSLLMNSTSPVMQQYFFEINLETVAVRHVAIAPGANPIFSADDSRAYFLGVDGLGVIDLNNFTVLFDSGPGIQMTQVYSKVSPSGSLYITVAKGEYGTNQYQTVAGVIPLVNDQPDQQAASIITLSDDQPHTNDWPAHSALVGSMLYVVTYDGKIVALDTNTNTISHTYNALNGQGKSVVAITVDNSKRFAYITYQDTPPPEDAIAELAIVDLANDSVVYQALPDGYTSFGGVSVSHDDTSLLLLLIPSAVMGDNGFDLLNAGIFGSVRYNVGSRTFATTPTLLPGGQIHLLYGANDFLGIITPSQDSINLRVLPVITPPPTPPPTPPVNPPPTPPSVELLVTPPQITTPRVVVPRPPASAAIQGKLGWFDRSALALASFIPAKAAIGFPWLLFLLLLLFALSLYAQSRNEIRKEKLNKEFIGKRHSIREQQDNFIALASHYLNTPITIIQNGIEVMKGDHDVKNDRIEANSISKVASRPAKSGDRV